MPYQALPSLNLVKDGPINPVVDSIVAKEGSHSWSGAPLVDRPVHRRLSRHLSRGSSDWRLHRTTATTTRLSELLETLDKVSRSPLTRWWQLSRPATDVRIDIGVTRMISCAQPEDLAFQLAVCRRCTMFASCGEGPS